jgi:hypothetical protein
MILPVLIYIMEKVRIPIGFGLVDGWKIMPIY